MNTQPNRQIEDIAEAARACRPVRPDGPWRILIGNQELEFCPAVIDDPVPTGRQLLKLAKARPVEEYMVFQMLRDGELEDLRLDETTDLREAGVERFLVFKGSETFRIELDRQVVEWGAPRITGRTLKGLAGVDPTTYGVWQEVPGEDDRLIDDSEFVDLRGPGLERFFTGIHETTEGRETASLPRLCRRYLTGRGIAFEEIEEGGQKAAVLRNLRLPTGRFNAPTADVLVLLPAGYPDCAPDMFFTDPWLRLASSSQNPAAADVAHEFAGRTWQRWSRHSDKWRIGRDGIWTVLKRVERALEAAT